MAALSVRNRISRCDVVELAEELFGARLCAGTVEAILERAARALSEPYEDLAERVRSSGSLNMDETGWRTAGERRAPWGAFSHRHAVFAIAPIATLRGAVIYRTLCLDSQSEQGERRIERLLSASVTCRLQRRSPFAYMTELLTAHARGDPVPLLA